jgi:hypothetical protein
MLSVDYGSGMVPLWLHVREIHTHAQAPGSNCGGKACNLTTEPTTGRLQVRFHIVHIYFYAV